MEINSFQKYNVMLRKSKHENIRLSCLLYEWALVLSPICYTHLGFSFVFAQQQQHSAYDLLHKWGGMLVSSNLCEDFLLSDKHGSTEVFDAPL